MIYEFCCDNSIILLFYEDKHVILLLNLIMVVAYSKNTFFFPLNALEVFACYFPLPLDNMPDHCLCC